MNTSVPSDAPMGVYIRKQKAAVAAPVAQPVENDDASSFGKGVGMHSPTMQRKNTAFVPHPSFAKSGLAASRLSDVAAGGTTRRVSFGMQPAESQAHNLRQHATIASGPAVSAVDSAAPLKNEAVEDAAALDQSAFLKLFGSATQREVDTCIQFAMHGGPLVKHSSRAHKAPVLATFRLTNDYSRLVWAEASKPNDEKYGLETESLLQVLVGAAAAGAIEGCSAGASTKSPSLRLVLLLEGDDKLRLEALDKVHSALLFALWLVFCVVTSNLQVSQRYWAFALHFISEPKNKSRLLQAAPRPALSLALSDTSSNVKSAKADASSAAKGSGSGRTTARSSAKATYNSYSEEQVTCFFSCYSKMNLSLTCLQLAVVRAFFSKARHGRLDALVQMLDAGMVRVTQNPALQKRSRLTRCLSTLLTNTATRFWSSPRRTTTSAL